MSEYAERCEIGTAINRHTKMRTMVIAAELNAFYPPYEQPVSGDMLTIMRHDTKWRQQRRRATMRTFESFTRTESTQAS